MLMNAQNISLGELRSSEEFFLIKMGKVFLNESD